MVDAPGFYTTPRDVNDGGWIDGRWCDIWAPDLARPLGLSWVWTVQTPPGERDEPLEPSDWYIPLPGTRREEGGELGWSVATVNEALHGWVAFHAGRPDLRMRYDDDLVSDWILEIVERDRGGGD